MASINALAIKKIENLKERIKHGANSSLDNFHFQAQFINAKLNSHISKNIWIQSSAKLILLNNVRDLKCLSLISEISKTVNAYMNSFNYSKSESEILSRQTEKKGQQEKKITSS